MVAETPNAAAVRMIVPTFPGSWRASKMSSRKGSDPLRLLILDALQDPGNVGTIIRTAAAFGVSATICLPGTVDLWNAKVVRSAVGAQFHHSCLTSTWDELDSFRRQQSISCLLYT